MAIMKKRAVFILLCAVFLITVASALDPAVPSTTEEYEQINTLIEQNKLVDDEGNLNMSSLDKFKSKAEIRIDTINRWFDEHFVWFRFFFGMGPEISWQFAFVIWVWLLLFVVFIMNAPLNLPGDKYSRLIGLGIFLLFVITHSVYYIGSGLHWIFGLIIDVVIPIGIVAVIILYIIAPIAGIWLLGLLSKVLSRFVQFLTAKKVGEVVDKTSRKLVQTYIERAKPK